MNADRVMAAITEKFSTQMGHTLDRVVVVGGGVVVYGMTIPRARHKDGGATLGGGGGEGWSGK